MVDTVDVLLRSVAGKLAIAFLPALSALAIDPSVPLASLQVRHWGPESGLPEETITSLATPGNGYVWLASNNGLIRFDGRYATVITPSEFLKPRATGPCANNVYTYLHQGEKGALWAGNQAGCLVRILRDRFGSFANFLLDIYDSPLANPDQASISGIYAFAGRHLVVHRGAAIAWPALDEVPGLSPFDANLRPKSPLSSALTPAPPGSTLVASAIDAAGRIWAATGTRQLFSRAPGQSGWSLHGALAGTPARLLPDHATGGVWIATTAGLQFYQSGHFETIDTSVGFPSKSITALYEDRHHCLWVGMLGSLGRMCQGRWDFLSVGVAQEEIFSAIREDAEGNLWVAGRWGNLFRLSISLFTTLTRQNGLPESHITGVAVDSSGQVWGTLRSNGVFHLDGKGRPVVHRHPALLEAPALVPDPLGGVFVASTRGLFHLSASGPLRPLPLKAAPVFRSNVALFAVSGDEILYSNILESYRFSRSSPTSAWDAKLLGGPPRIRQFARDPSGQIWAVSQFGGLLRLNDARYEPARGLHKVPISAWYSLAYDSEGYLFLGTADGLLLYSIREQSFVSPHPLLPGEHIFHIGPDRLGKLWCSTRRGLLRLDRAQTIAAFRRQSLSLPVERYGENQALPTTNFGLGTSASGAMDHQGRLWFPGILGLVSLDPSSFVRNPKPPALHFLAIRADGSLQHANQPLRLPSGTRKIDLDFLTIPLDTLGGDFCRMMLFGFDPGWVPCNESRTAHYTSLPPGPYEFRIQTSSLAGVWNGPTITIPFEHQYALHERLWFRALALLLVFCALGFFLYRRHQMAEARTRELESRVEERTQSLAAATSAAQAASKAKTEFLATMSHEIRTPMNGVLGAVQLLSQSQLDADQRRLVEVIRNSGEDLVSIVDDILSLSKVEAGKLSLERVPVTVAPLCDNLVSLFHPKAESQGISLTYAVDPGLPTAFLCDPQRLRQILLNLIGNAVKFTPSGSVHLHVEPTADSQRVCFSIMDTGIGIPPDKIPGLFDAFVQADSSTTRRFEGTGLGLAIVDRFVRAMGGSIQVDSSPGQGSTFRVELPLEPSEVASDLPVVDATPLAAGLDVLIAEDNATNRLVFERMLRSLGCRVRLAANGREALELLRQAPADLVLMDCQMPELDGYAATTELRSWGAPYSTLPVIAITASAMPEDRAHCLEVGMNDFLSKPLIFSALQEKLALWGAASRQP